MPVGESCRRRAFRRLRLSRSLALSLVATGVVGDAEGQVGAAEQVTRQALHAVEADSAAILRAEWERALLERPAGHLAALGLATLDALTYRFESAERRFESLRLAATDSAILARAALGLGALRQAQGLFRDAEAPLRDAAAISKARADSVTLAESLLLLASTRMRTNGMSAGLLLLDSADAMLPAADVLVRGAARCTRASFHALSGRDDVLEIAAEGAALGRREGHRRIQAACLFAEAQYFVHRGDLAQVDVRLARAAELQRAAGHRSALAANLQWRGYLLTTVASYGMALRILREAIAEAEASRNLSVLAWANANLAQISLTLDDRYAANSHAIVAERMMEQQGDRRGLGIVRGLRAELAMRAADTVSASRLREEAQRLLARFGSPELEYTVLSWRFRRYAAARDWRSAHAMLDSMSANLRTSGRDGWLRGESFGRATLALMEGDYVTAERVLTEMGDPEEVRQPLQRHELLVMRAELRARTGRYGEAEAELRRASDVIDGWRAQASSRALRHLAFQRTNAFGDSDHAFATVLHLLAANGQAEAAFELSERRRARQLGDEMARLSALRESRSDTIGAAGTVPAGITVAGLVAALPDEQTTLVEYVTGRGGELTTAFIVSRRGWRAIALAPMDSLAPAIARFVGLLQADGPTDGLARSLGAALVDPVLAALPDGVRRLVIVPDDVLHRVPFDALQLSDGRYAIERFTVATVPSAAIAAALWRRASPAHAARVLALGDPQFSTASDPTAGNGTVDPTLIGRGGLVRLAASGGEARRAARFAERAHVRLRGSASERFLKTARLDTFEVLHFATHALVDEREIGRSALVLAAGEGEDGFVTSGDLAALRLRAELVVLSACRSAGGVLLGGEGVHGLAAPLLSAGARTVVATSWHVDDAAAARLVDRLYRALAAGASTGDALRSAKLERLRSGAPPSEWAAWTLIGDGAAGVPLRHPPNRLHWWAAAAAVLALIGYGAGTVKRSKREVRSAPSG